jgi:streptogramin lyase
MRIRLSLLIPCLASLPLASFLTGCSMTDLSSPDLTGSAAVVSIRGNVHGGQQPIAGAHVYLFAANTTGNAGSGIAASTANASVSLLVGSSTGSADTVGAYVLTDANGNFTISGDYTCAANTQVYLYALGGNPGTTGGVPNTAAGLMSAVGNCPSNGSFATTTPFVLVNEVSTVAAAYSFAGYATDATHVSSSGTAGAMTGIANAFLNAPNLAAISTGQALTATPAGNGTVPQATINTIADILASCINSTGPASSSCVTLFANARASGTTGTVPTDTATAAINIAHNPASGITALYSLGRTNGPFQPTLTTQPNDFLLGIKYNGVGTVAGGLNGAYTIAIDAQGAAWFTNPNDNSITKLSSTGSPESPAGGFKTGGQQIPTGIAIDTNGNAWIADAASSNIVEYASNGAAKGTFIGGGLHSPQAVGIDGSGNVWVANFSTTTPSNNNPSEFNSAGVALSPVTGYAGSFTNEPTGVAIDRFGYAWFSNQSPAPGGDSKVNTNGAPISSAGLYSIGGMNNPQGIAIDAGNNVWNSDYGSNAITELNTNGAAVSPSGGYTGGGLNNPEGIAVDGNGNIWVTNAGTNTLSEFNNSGTALSPSTGYGPTLFTVPGAVEIDASGNLWVANYNQSSPTANAVTEVIGASVPRVTPLSVAVKNSQLGTRP